MIDLTPQSVKRYSLEDLLGAYNTLRSYQGFGKSKRVPSHEAMILELKCVKTPELKEWMELRGIDPAKGRAFLRKLGIPREKYEGSMSALVEKFL